MISNLGTECDEDESGEESYEHSFVESDDNETWSAEYQDSDDSTDVQEEHEDGKDIRDVCRICRKSISPTV